MFYFRSQRGEACLGILIIAIINFSSHTNDEEPLIFQGGWRLLQDELGRNVPTRSEKQPLFIDSDKLKSLTTIM
ncbi:hypothetical protein ABE61_12970 [Lysinibacillus sphaericus]|nr:hypothetical protein [Lysinibacillus sphaericus]MBG9478984.1 hypothetical protein [Lysinibacillus sphaericus]MBG9593320.1 hypothetical protein [Lysinibacillus sphaericus]